MKCVKLLICASRRVVTSQGLGP